MNKSEIQEILHISFIKTIRINFKFFPLRTALKLPILVSRNIRLKNIKGTITLANNPKLGLIKFGFGTVGIFDKKYSRGIIDLCGGNLHFLGKASIVHGSKLFLGDKGQLTIGDNFIITAESTISCHNNIQIGDGCLFSWDILLLDNDQHKIMNEEGVCINQSKPILIGDKVWIGCRVLVLKGANIPNNVVIGAQSIVSKKLEYENSIYAGNPLQQMKNMITWQK